MLLCELYQEENSSVVEHNGKTYRVNDLLKSTENSKVTKYNVSELQWMLSYTKLDKKRISKANLKYPILVTKLDDQLVVIDGAHRLSKAVDEKIKTLPGKLVTQKQLDDAEVK